LVLVLGILVGSSHCADSESSARLIVAKNVLNQFVVEGKDLTIHYTLYNVGSRLVFGLNNIKNIPDNVVVPGK
jgi:translocon-associated protein subunit beta